MLRNSEFSSKSMWIYLFQEENFLHGGIGMVCYINYVLCEYNNRFPAKSDVPLQYYSISSPVGGEQLRLKVNTVSPVLLS